MAYWGAVADAAIQFGSAWMQSDAQRDANKTNVKLQRENNQFIERMSNTAMQRRADDIERAGGNRALAFTNGEAASSPVVAPAQVEPTFKADVKTNFTGAALAKAQMQNIAAQTAKTVQEGRVAKVTADNMEKYGAKTAEWNANTAFEQSDQANIRTQMMRSLNVSSAADAKQKGETVDAIIAKAKQDAAKGQLNLDALKNIARIGGIEGGQLAPLIKLLLQLFTATRD